MYIFKPKTTPSSLRIYFEHACLLHARALASLKRYLQKQAFLHTNFVSLFTFKCNFFPSQLIIARLTHIQVTVRVTPQVASRRPLCGRSRAGRFATACAWAPNVKLGCLNGTTWLNTTQNVGSSRRPREIRPTVAVATVATMMTSPARRWSTSPSWKPIPPRL